MHDRLIVAPIHRKCNIEQLFAERYQFVKTERVAHGATVRGGGEVVHDDKEGIGMALSRCVSHGYPLGVNIAYLNTIFGGRCTAWLKRNARCACRRERGRK